MKINVSTLVIIAAFLFSLDAYAFDPVDQVTFPADGPFIVFGNTNIDYGYPQRDKFHYQVFKVECVSDSDPSYHREKSSKFMLRLRNARPIEMMQTPHSITIVERDPPTEGNITCTSYIKSSSYYGYPNQNSLIVWPTH